MRNVHYFQHVPFEGLGTIEEWLTGENCRVSKTQFYNADQEIPSLDDYDALIVMGGPMSIHDQKQFPWLKDEKEHIRKAITANKPVLGICLGAQLIASALGATVKANQHKEIGWFPIELNKAALGHELTRGLANSMTVFHWHGETFSLPNNAINLATSQACQNQGFIYNNNVIGLQFHLEMNKVSIEALITACIEELSPQGQSIQEAETLVQRAATETTKPALFKLLDNWLSI